MNKIFFTVAILFSLSSFAQLQGYQTTSCQYWAPNSSGSGYVCQTYPTNIFVAEGHSFASVIRAQDARIAQLEKDVADLKKNLQTGRKLILK